jgi:hypothetical protein
MISKEQENNSMFSGRLLDFCLTNYVKDHEACYFLLFDKRDSSVRADDNEPTWGKGARASTYFHTLDELLESARLSNRTVTVDDWMEFDLMSEYKIMIRRYRKLFFDLFRRGTWFHFEYTAQDGSAKTAVTTFCQLTFFQWAVCFQLKTYWEYNHDKVRTHYKQLDESGDMNARKKQVVLYSRAHTLPQKARPFRTYAASSILAAETSDAVESRGNGAGAGGGAGGAGGGGGAGGAGGDDTVAAAAGVGVSEDSHDESDHHHHSASVHEYKLWSQESIGGQPVFSSAISAPHAASSSTVAHDVFELLPFI